MGSHVCVPGQVNHQLQHMASCHCIGVCSKKWMIHMSDSSLSPSAPSPLSPGPSCHLSATRSSSLPSHFRPRLILHCSPREFHAPCLSPVSSSSCLAPSLSLSLSCC